MTAQTPVARALSETTLGSEVIVKNMTIVPLLRAPEAPEAPLAPAPFSTVRHPSAPFSTLKYVLLDEALAGGITEVTEVSEQGSVPELRVVNRGPNPVLIIDGEELLGAKQNRVVNLSILVPARSDLVIPVSCVESGRWRARSRAFTASPRTQYASGRAKRVQQVTYSMLHRGERMSDQSAVWADIADKSVRLQSASPTSAMEALFTDYASSIDEFVTACHPADGQVGALFAIDGVVVGFDLFDRPETLQKILPKLVRSVAVDAIDRETANRASSVPASHDAALRGHAERFIAAAAAAPQHVAPAIGLGDDVRLMAHGMTGAVLVVDGGVVHFSAFSAVLPA